MKRLSPILNPVPLKEVYKAIKARKKSLLQELEDIGDEGKHEQRYKSLGICTVLESIIKQELEN